MTDYAQNLNDRVRTGAPTERRVALLLILATAASAVLVAFLRPGLVRFWPFTAADFVQLITPLFLLALFIERVVEVFLTTWRAAGAKRHELDVEESRGGTSEDLKRRLADYKSDTQRIAFLAGTTIGVIVSALGVRVLQLFVDPAVFEALPGGQRSVFIVADVLFTGALLGGGADALHKLVLVFTNFMDSTAELAKKRKDQ